jgi:hypothetical protein
VLVEFQLEAAPVQAFPPKVLRNELALPLVADWVLVFETVTKFRLVWFTVVEVVTEAELYENGPVLDITTVLACAAPPITKLAIPAPAQRNMVNLITYPPLLSFYIT